MAYNSVGKDIDCLEPDLDDQGIEIDDADAYEDEDIDSVAQTKAATEQDDKHNKSETNTTSENSFKQNGYNTSAYNAKERNNVIMHNDISAFKAAANDQVQYGKVKKGKVRQHDKPIAAKQLECEHVKLDHLKSRTSNSQDHEGVEVSEYQNSKGMNTTAAMDQVELNADQISVEPPMDHVELGNPAMDNVGVEATDRPMDCVGVDDADNPLAMACAGPKEYQNSQELDTRHSAIDSGSEEDVASPVGLEEAARPSAMDHVYVENVARPSAMDHVKLVDTVMDPVSLDDGPRPSAMDFVKLGDTAMERVRVEDGPRPSAMDFVKLGDTAMDHVHVDDGPRPSAMERVRVEDGPRPSAMERVRVEVLEWQDSQDSKEEDEEVEGIMRSTEMLDRLQDQLKRRVKDQLSVEAKHYRNRSKSVDDGKFRHPIVDFAKYGISVGVNNANELLPGIEEFLCTVLAQEALSPQAEEQRQFFLERLDIIKMPPSVPPRPQSLGVNLFPVDPSQSPSNRDSILSNRDSIPSNRDSIPSLEQDDFAAYQRELSRALVETDAGASPKPEDEDVKVYDDIDFVNISAADGTVVDEPQAEESMYEIPQLKRSLSDSGYEKAIDISPVPRAASTENITQTEEPPPLPPRQERTMSEATLRSSVGSILDERTQDLVYRGTPGNQDNTLGTPATVAPDNRSMRSADDLLTTDDNLDEADGMSCDSIDNVGPLEQDSEIMEKLGIALPKPKLKKRKSTRRKLGLSLSSLKESTISFRALEDIVLSGELHYRSKLSWTKKLVALTNGRLVCYKAEKYDCRPSQIVVLAGYQATYQKREGNKRGFEITLCHDMFEMYSFLADFKEWAEIWCEHLNAAADGRKAPGPVLHLARGSSIGCPGENEYNLTRVSHGDSSSSNLSLASSDGFDFDPGTVKVKKRDVSGTRTTRMGSFAFRATQFFESLGKSSKLRKSSSTDVYRPHARSESQTSLSEMSEPCTPQGDIEEERPLEITKHIKHQGFLDIYSSFNKRKWGKRWCMVHENNFECYRTQTSDVCELEFLLRNCVLRRAIAETKSELGLMLMENQREKLTIEPLNWTELGSWLRVLMQETSTPAVPDGLQAYVDASNPYHEPVEVTRLSDPFPVSPPVFTAGKEGDDERHSSTPSRNRDSGNCSSESMFGSLERRPTDHKTHKNYTDSSLPRVSADGTGDIYTQVRKTSKAGLTRENQSKSKIKTRSGSDVSADRFDYDFSATIPSMKPGESLMDEIMSQFNTQLSVSYEVDKDGNIFNFDNIPENKDRNIRKPRKSSNPTDMLSAIETVVSPIKNQYSEAPVSNATENLLCSSFLDESSQSDQRELTPVVPNIEKKMAARTMASHKDDCVRSSVDGAGIKTARRGSSDRGKTHGEPERKAHPVTDGTGKMEEEVVRRSHKKDNSDNVRKRSSLVQDEESLRVTLEELRIKLVQLKKDRICIRDRKQKISSEINRGYLEAEFHRLNTECRKVQDEISYLEKLQNSEAELTHGGRGKIEAIPECDSDSDLGKNSAVTEFEAGAENSHRDHGDIEVVPEGAPSAGDSHGGLGKVEVISECGTSAEAIQGDLGEIEAVSYSELGAEPSHKDLDKIEAIPKCESDKKKGNNNLIDPPEFKTTQLSLEGLGRLEANAECGTVAKQSRIDLDKKDVLPDCDAKEHKGIDKQDPIAECDTGDGNACDVSMPDNIEHKQTAKSVIQAALGMKMKQTLGTHTDKMKPPITTEKHGSTVQHGDAAPMQDAAGNLKNLNLDTDVPASVDLDSKQQSAAACDSDLNKSNRCSEVEVDTEESGVVQSVEVVPTSTDCTTPDSAIADCTTPDSAIADCTTPDSAIADCTTPDSAVADCITPDLAITDCTTNTDSSETHLITNTTNTETILKQPIEQLADTDVKDSDLGVPQQPPSGANTEQSGASANQQGDTNGSIQDLSSAFESKLRIHSSESE